MVANHVAPAMRQAWLATILTLLTAIALLGGIFSQEFRDMYRVWVESTAYNHCFLVLPLVGYLIWERRSALVSTTPKPQFLTLALLPAFSILWLAAATLSIHEAQQFIVITMAEVVLLSVLGWEIYRRLLGPLLYLYFMVPSGAFLVPTLQSLTAAMAVRMLQLVGVPVLSDGIFIEIPAGKFIIAEACAGLRFLVASVAFGVFFALLSYRSWNRRALFIALAATVPVLANALRAFGIIYAAQVLNSATAAVADHVIYGWVFFSVILILLIWIGRAFSDQRVVVVERGSPPSPSYYMAPTRTAAVGLLAVLLAGVGPTYAALRSDQSLAAAVVHARPPMVAAPWQPAETDTLKWTPVVYGADYTFRDAYTDGSVTVRRFVALYLAHGRTNNLIRGENRVADSTDWSIAPMPPAMINVSGRRERVNLSEIVSGDRRFLVVWFYALDDSIVADALTAKFHQLRSLISAAPAFSATVAIAIDMPDRTAPPLPAVSRFLEAMEPTPLYLRKISQ